MQLKVKSSFPARSTLAQARVSFAEDNLTTIGLEASAEGNTEKRPCRGICALPGGQMAADRTILQNILFDSSSIENR